MSNNLVSQPLPVAGHQMEPVSNQDVSVLNMQINMTGPMSTNPASQFAVSNQQQAPSVPVSYITGTENMIVRNNQLMQNQKVGEMGPMWNYVGVQKPLLPTKRKAAVETLSSNSSPQQSSLPNKRVAHMENQMNPPGSSQVSVMNKRHTQLQPVAIGQGSPNLPNKRMMRNESLSGKSGSQRVQTPRSRTVAVDMSPKVKTESVEPVRSKMRETLAAALSVGSEKSPNEDKNPREVGSVPAQAHVNSQPSGSNTPASETKSQIAGSMDMIKETSVVDKQERGGSATGETAVDQSIPVQTGKSEGQEPRYNYVMPDADGSFGDTFFVKDELLQGNGLSWAWDMEVAELKEVQTNEISSSVHLGAGTNGNKQGQAVEKPNVEDRSVSRNRTEPTVSSPQELAFRIEAELFKLFGGVNKKYKEKGRSLMFNLKDRSNPELREKVLSGQISPERLCSMTPEELASKELSEWRQAKAEELDKMIVLPDSDVDIRRLVKKTHKGEYQVEVEQDDGVSVEVSVGSSSFSQFRPKKKKEARPSSEDDEEEKETTDVEKSSQNQDPASSITIPADGTDFMQELIVDEFKDEGFLPPIVSLDEFMESLNSEPPFENLPVDAKETKLSSNKDDPEAGCESDNRKVSSEPASVASAASADPVEAKAGATDQLNVAIMEPPVSVKASETTIKRTNSPPASVVLGEHLWEGELLLTLSSSVTVIGLFRSGEKTTTKEWPSSMEIKGRVRLDAFEKFLQELPMSRSRAVMVMHFVLKDASSQIQKSSLSEAVDSYVADERLGFGEPNPGVELYFCPPHTRIIGMLSRHLSKDQTDILKQTDNGLIGVVVWRRAHINSALSPNSSSHHKHHRKHFSTRRQDNVNANANSNLTPKSSPFGHGQSLVKNRLPPQLNNDDDDDDIPPGFGPGAAARDEDDLPEFNFSGNLNSSGQKIPAQMSSGSRMIPYQQSSRPVEQMRQLIYKYGQTGDGVNWNGNRGAAIGTGTRSWAQEDDDDDIPEWQPQLPQSHQQPPEVPLHGIQHPPPMAHIVGQVAAPVMTVQPPVNVMQNGVRWVQPPGPHGLRPNTAAAVSGQFYGGQWRQEAPRSRGF